VVMYAALFSERKPLAIGRASGTEFAAPTGDDETEREAVLTRRSYQPGRRGQSGRNERCGLASAARELVRRLGT